MASSNTKRNVGKNYSDLYNTPVEALDALSACVSFDKNKTYFEPCSGKRVIADYFSAEKGINMITNELFEHGKSDYTEDYLRPNSLASACWDFDYIITNPPYKVAQEFVTEGFKYAKEQYHLVRLAFLEGKTRKEQLYTLGHLKNVYIFSYRISCTKGMEEEPQANAVAYCWLHFDRDYVGNPTLIWI